MPTPPPVPPEHHPAPTGTTVPRAPVHRPRAAVPSPALLFFDADARAPPHAGPLPHAIDYPTPEHRAVRALVPRPRRRPCSSSSKPALPPPRPLGARTPKHRPTPLTAPRQSTAPSVPSFLIHDASRAPPPSSLHSHRRGLQERVDSCFPTPHGEYVAHCRLCV